MTTKQETTDVYRSTEAVTMRSAAATVRRIVHEFGDPNRGDYKDPYASEVPVAKEFVMEPGMPVNLQESMNFS